MSEPKGNYLGRTVPTCIDGFLLRGNTNMGNHNPNAEIPEASEETWKKIRKNLQEIAEAYLKKVGGVC